ncbi:unnamed protein product [Microthlaspi erraticum]|uniref:Uncharacterized protein n=1 Tax=Microthlaspi erraticum TaxID=1685480 RepID=A0A6D2HYK6_9BRAS|nr:unnamed protein product [Microthlaspi erraticum]
MVYTRVGVWIPQCPPKNWETRSWSGDGRRPSGALHATGFGSLDRACGSSSSSSSSSKWVWLPWPWWSLASSNCIGVPSTGEVLVRLGSYSNPGSQTGAPPGQLDPQLDRVEFPLFGLDRVRWSSWSVWPWNSSSFSACCLLLPLARKKRLCEALGQEPPLGGEE